jgi:hypothetical protein
MEPNEAAEVIKKCCNTISAELTRLNPAVNDLGNKPIQDEIFKALFQLTKDVEAVKKFVRKAESGI